VCIFKLQHITILSEPADWKCFQYSCVVQKLPSFIVINVRFEVLKESVLRLGGYSEMWLWWWYKIACCHILENTVLVSTRALHSESLSFKPWLRDQYSWLKFSTAILSYSRQMLGQNHCILYFLKKKTVLSEPRMNEIVYSIIFGLVAHKTKLQLYVEQSCVNTCYVLIQWKFELTNDLFIAFLTSSDPCE
jgi:hypothetical protein